MNSNHWQRNQGFMGVVGGLVVLALAVSCTVPFAPETEAEKLSRQAHSTDREVREPALGILLTKHLRPGMTRRQVEALLGPPERVTDGGWIAKEGTIYTDYYCRLPDKEGTHLMSVDYEVAGDQKFIKVSGPHVPN